MGFTETQIYDIKQMTKGPIPFEVWRKWDQRPLRGLHMRGMFTITSRHALSISRDGWRVAQGTLKPKLRKDPRKPVFGRRTSREPLRRAQ